MILKKDSIISISRLFNLSCTGFEQDWDIEMADSSRINEFLRFYPRLNLSDSERIALMALIFASYDDLLNEMTENKIWIEITTNIVKDKELFKDLLDYWSLVEEKESDDLFNITTKVRRLKEELHDM